MRATIIMALVSIGIGQAHGQDSVPVLNEIIATHNPLDTLVFDEIIAYNINYDTVNNKKTYHQMSVNTSDYKLEPWQTVSKRIVDTTLFDDIINLFSDTATYGDNYADCFEPRFVLQFMHYDNEQFKILICEECGYLISTLPIPAAYIKYYDNQYKNEKGEQINYRRYLKGFSKAGTKKINELCTSLNMAYCANQGNNK